MTKKTKQYIEAARNIHQNDDIEIDDDAKLSDVDGEGAWVSAWVWVAKGEVEDNA